MYGPWVAAVSAGTFANLTGWMSSLNDIDWLIDWLTDDDDDDDDDDTSGP